MSNLPFLIAILILAAIVDTQPLELENKIDLDLEIKKQINFEQNRQLNSFSLNFYKKLKQNSIINEY